MASILRDGFHIRPMLDGSIHIRALTRDGLTLRTIKLSHDEWQQVGDHPGIAAPTEPTDHAS